MSSNNVDNVVKIEFLNNIFESFPVLIFIVDDENKKIIYANKMACKLLGHDIINKPCSDILSKDGVCCDFCFNENLDFNEKFNVTYNEKIFQVSKAANITIENRVSRIIVGIDMTEIIRSEKKLVENAATDLMTNILNRQAGLDKLSYFIEEVRNDNVSIFTICYIDINDLKFVNDNYGHQQGDDYIITVVDIIRSAIRQTDYFARMGGDEFLLIFPKCVLAVVENIFDIVVNKLEIHNNTSGNEFKYSISYGIMEINNQSSLDVEDIINAVDSKMYYMKEEYRKNRVLPSINH